MPPDTGLLNLLWCDRLMSELASAGVTRVFIAPGSRSTPLTLAAARQPALTVVDHFDERGLAFAALGCARATGKAAAVITTSGTAVANLLPAAVEAFQDQVPLLLLTADRPLELRGSGANQTIDQVEIFGRHARFFRDVPPPDGPGPAEPVEPLVEQVRAHLAEGPVHLNLQFREPLQPAGPLPSRPPPAPDCGCPPGPALRGGDEEALRPLRDRLESKPRVWLLIGPGLHPLEQGVVLEVARRLNWTVVPDVLSGLRLERLEEVCLAHHHDLALLGRPGGPADPPALVVHVGGRMVSKRLGQYLASLPGVEILHAHPHDARMEVVPNRVRHLRAGALALGSLHDAPRGTPCPGLAEDSLRVEQALADWFARDTALTEPWVARAVARLSPDRHGLFIGSSMPVRDLEMFGEPRGKSPRVAGNRGASGIDGTLACAAGFNLGLGRAATVLLGDLSALHDLNSLALVRSRNLPLTTVVVNNQGGGIFRFLPPSGLEPEVGALWTTPHAWQFGGAAAMFGLPYQRVETREAFSSAYAAAVASGGPGIIEVVSDREENFRAHQDVQNAVRRAFAP